MFVPLSSRRDLVRVAALARSSFLHGRGAADRRRDWLSMVGAAAAYVCTSPAFAIAKRYSSVATYDFVSSGVVKGSQQTVCLPDGSLDVHFQFHRSRARPDALQHDLAR